MEFLNVSSNKINDEFAGQIFKGKFDSLKELVISNNLITKTDHFKEMDNLRLLDVSQNSVTLIDGDKLPKNLKFINIFKNNITWINV